MENKDIVNVTRYLRPESYNPWGNTLPSNLFGITIDYQIDYQEDTVKARWSVCSGDNFSRKVGKEEAVKNDYLIVFPLEEVEEFAGLTEALTFELNVLFPSKHKFYFSDYEYKHALFSKALRKLKQGTSPNSEAS